MPKSEEMTNNALHEIFVHGVKDMYYAEKKIVKALEKMSGAAQDAKLKAALADHAKETAGCVKMLEEVFSLIGLKPQGEKCDAIDGILKEGDGILEDFGDTPACDAGIIFSCQAVEHYEITRFGTLREWAREMSMKDCAKLLEGAKDEHYEADEKLTDLAEARSNKKAETSAKSSQKKAPAKPK